MKKIKNGDNVTVNYTGKLEDGTIFDSSFNEGREPLNVVLGEGNLIQGFEEGLMEMSIGEKKTIEIDPTKAYGIHYPEAIVTVPKSQFPENIKVGETMQGMTPEGRPIMVSIIDIDGDNVTIDANHPLAGKKLIFELEVLGIE